MREKLTFVKKPWFGLVGGILLGAFIVLAVRFATYHAEHVHYHANFAVFINGQREAFKAPQYYQEVAICMTGHGITTPEQRAHMHQNVNSVVHVHDHAVTWGQFFDNLGWSIGPDFIETDTPTMYRADATNKLHLYLNGQDYTDLTNIANKVIGDKDRLLISYGDISNATLKTEYAQVPSTAAEHDASKDPASCAGMDMTSTSDRLKHLF